MKRTNLGLACGILLVGLAACNQTGDVNSSADSTSTSATDTGMTSTAPATDPATMAPMGNKTPLSAADSMFAVNAATGGMMEVESSNVALQNASSERIKAFATTMVNDHNKANSELMGLASARGMALPSSLPADKQKHIDDMKKMTGTAFDKHYISMMMSDHKKTIADFEKQASSGNDPELKSFAEKTLPTLKMHSDSVMAISKMKM